MTFLDLYRTLTSFALYKLFSDENLVYPPPMDVGLDAKGEGVGKFKLIEREDEDKEEQPALTADGKRISKKDVKRSIKSIQKTGNVDGGDDDDDMQVDEPVESKPSRGRVCSPSQ